MWSPLQPMIAVGRVNFSFALEEFGDLHLVLSKDGKTFFEETIPVHPNSDDALRMSRVIRPLNF